MPGRPLEEQSRAAGAQHTVADLGHFQARRHFGGDALELAARLELRNEFPQVRVLQGFSPYRKRLYFLSIKRSLSASAKSSSMVLRPRTG